MVRKSQFKITLIQFVPSLDKQQTPQKLAERNKLEFETDENDYENIHAKTLEEEKEVGSSRYNAMRLTQGVFSALDTFQALHPPPLSICVNV